MIIALGVMFVTSLLLVAAFTAVNGDVKASYEDTTQKQAYYAALAGIQEYEYKLQDNPDYWETCEQPKSTVPEESNERYEIKLLTASTSKGATECSTASPFTTMIESSGSAANTFRIESKGYSGTDKRAIVATFQVVGFLNYVYYTNYETEDPGLYNSPAECEKKYYKEWSPKGLGCVTITFSTGDSVNGPMHTNDATKVEGSATFGRKEHIPTDSVEINGGTYPTKGCKGSSAVYYTATKCYTEGTTLVPPESDTSLRSYVEPANKFVGVTYLVLKGNEVEATYYEGGKAVKTTVEPANGLIYVEGTSGCGYKYEPQNSDNSNETSKEEGCGNVYVSGNYSKPLTIAAENDVIIDGNIYPTSVSGNFGAEPTGTTTLGLIASHYVRVYHACSGGKNGTDYPNIWIYAAILSTSHSFVVDNFECGAKLGELNVYGAIAQDYRGIVTKIGSTGYEKDYKYDERLATDEPPYFLAPLKSGWKVIRETAPTGG
jgi:Tfp pilus assembly protein PilX